MPSEYFLHVVRQSSYDVISGGHTMSQRNKGLGKIFKFSA